MYRAGVWETTAPPPPPCLPRGHELLLSLYWLHSRMYIKRGIHIWYLLQRKTPPPIGQNIHYFQEINMLFFRQWCTKISGKSAPPPIVSSSICLWLKKGVYSFYNLSTTGLFVTSTSKEYPIYSITSARVKWNLCHSTAWFTKQAEHKIINKWLATMSVNYKRLPFETVQTGWLQTHWIARKRHLQRPLPCMWSNVMTCSAKYDIKIL